MLIKVMPLFKILEAVPKIITWLQIALAPLLVGGIIGFFFYASYPKRIGLPLAVLTIIIGLIQGILLARRIEKKRGVVEFMSRVNATPELDNQTDD